MENLTWQKWIMLAKNGKEFVLFFGGPHLFKDGRQWEPIFSDSRIYSLLIIIVVLCLFSPLKMWSWRKLVKMGNVPWSPQNNEWTLGITITPGMLTNIPPNKCGTINLKQLLHSALLPPLVWCFFWGFQRDGVVHTKPSDTCWQLLRALCCVFEKIMCK